MKIIATALWFCICSFGAPLQISLDVTIVQRYDFPDLYYQTIPPITGKVNVTVDSNPFSQQLYPDGVTLSLHTSNGSSQFTSLLPIDPLSITQLNPHYGGLSCDWVRGSCYFGADFGWDDGEDPIRSVYGATVYKDYYSLPTPTPQLLTSSQIFTYLTSMLLDGGPFTFTENSFRRDYNFPDEFQQIREGTQFSGSAVTSTPEPNSLQLFIIGSAAIIILRQKFKRQKNSV